MIHSFYFQCLKLFQEKRTTHLDLKAKTTSNKVTSTTREKRKKSRRETCKEQAIQLKSGLSQQPHRLRSLAHNSNANKITMSSPRLFHTLEISFLNQHS